MGFEFIADRAVLDFVPTLAERGHADVEQLQTVHDLEDWIRQSGLVDDISVTPADLDRARNLREAAFRLVQALIDHTPPRAADLALMNETAARPIPVVQLRSGSVHRDGDITAVLAALARDAIELHDSPDRELLRWCRDQYCTRPFIDRSHGARRRWCGMRGCGDRAKAAAYRQRQRQHPKSRTASA